jgi:hypothetical protein
MSPEEVVDRMGTAYNARDIEGYVASFAEDAVVINVEAGARVAVGIAALREYYRTRFALCPDLRSDVISRQSSGSFVVDRERVDGIGADPLEVIAIYEVRDSRICSLLLVSPRLASDLKPTDAVTAVIPEEHGSILSGVFGVPS